MPRALFRCDQCTWEEWRDATESVTLCPVCGYMRWEVVAEAPSAAADESSEEEDPRRRGPGK